MLINLSRTFAIVPLPSGGRGLYEIDPQHMPRAGVPESLRWPIELGRPIAHSMPDDPEFWCRAGSWRRIEDQKLLTLIGRVPEFTAADVAEGAAK